MSYLRFESDPFLDLGRGCGASERIDDIIDEEAIIENDGRSVTRTMFYAGDAKYDDPDKQKQMKRLAKWNDGMWESERASRNFKADMNRSKEVLCQQAELTSLQQESVMWSMKRIPVNRFGCYNTEKVTLSVMIKVCERDGRDLRQEDAFQDLMNRVGITSDKLDSVCRIAEKYPFAFDAGVPVPEEYK